MKGFSEKPSTPIYFYLLIFHRGGWEWESKNFLAWLYWNFIKFWVKQQNITFSPLYEKHNVLIRSNMVYVSSFHKSNQLQRSMKLCPETAVLLINFYCHGLYVHIGSVILMQFQYVHRCINKIRFGVEVIRFVRLFFYFDFFWIGGTAKWRRLLSDPVVIVYQRNFENIRQIWYAYTMMQLLG